MSAQQPIQITVVIAGRPYPLVIHANDEPTVLNLVNEVNQSAQQFANLYPNRDKQDHLAMTALSLAVELNKLQQVADPALPARLEQLEAQLSALLQKQK
jgi:cell division protein ZapA (FtsZ GTPase activity inhibitor)